jgi:plasmid stabilization system protein ParE
MAYEILYSAEAESELEGILEWLLYERRAGETGLRWFQRLKDKISEFPERCALAPESRSLPFKMRQLFYGRKTRVYRVLFTITGNVVYILAIRRPRQDSLSQHG